MSNKHWKWSKPHPNKVIIPKEKIEKLYSEDKTMSEIAEILNTTKRVIHLRMQEYGIKRRKMTGKNHGSWKGGRVKKMGYWAIWNPNHPRANNIGYVREHILVMEKHLNRPIDRTEHTHHIDFDRLNNNVENLWVSDNSRHHIADRSIHKLVKTLLEKNIIKFNRKKGIYEMK